MRLRLVRVKAFPKNRYFLEMLFFEKENVFMCLVAFQKKFRKIFYDVWLYSWKYHRKHIFYLLLTFSQLPNKHIMSFIPKNSNKTQKDSIFSRWDRDRDRDRSDLDRRDRDRNLADLDRDRAKRRSARSRLMLRKISVDRNLTKHHADLAFASAVRSCPSSNPVASLSSFFS